MVTLDGSLNGILPISTFECILKTEDFELCFIQDRTKHFLTVYTEIQVLCLLTVILQSIAVKYNHIRKKSDGSM